MSFYFKNSFLYTLKIKKYIKRIIVYNDSQNALFHLSYTGIYLINTN